MLHHNDHSRRQARFPVSPPPYAGDHAAMDFDASRNGADAAREDRETQATPGDPSRPDAQPSGKVRKIQVQ